MNAKRDSGGDRGIGGRLLEKMLMPIIATAASAAATYAAKKGPQFLDEKLAPRLRELGKSTGAGAEQLPAKAKAMAGDAVDVAEQLTDRARSAAGDAAGAVGGAAGSNGRRQQRISAKDLDRRQRERASARAQRRTSRK